MQNSKRGTPWNKLQPTDREEIITQFKKATPRIKYRLDEFKFKKTSKGWIIVNPFEVHA